MRKKKLRRPARPIETRLGSKETFKAAARVERRTAKRSFPIVGIGASAGGLEAMTQLLKHLPADTGMAFVLVQHLDPTHESALSSLLSRTTRLPVHEVSNGMAVQPNRVY